MTTKRFRVAFSFPRAHREYVRKVATVLAGRFGKDAILFDEFHKAEFAVPKLALKLPALYHKDSDLIVPVLGTAYTNRDWCGLEWSAIFAHIKEGHEERVMLFRTDDAEIPGLFDLEGSIGVDACPPEEAAKLILERLALNERRPREHYLSSAPAPAADIRMSPSRLPKKHDHGVFEGRDGVLADLDALWAAAVADAPGRARIVSLVAIGGAGKTTVASRWKDRLLAREGHGGVERYFDWSFYSQGTRSEGGARMATDSTVFVAAALTFFGDQAMADSPKPAWDKGQRLAELVSRHRALLILDGLEPLQHPPGPQKGQLQDDALRALFGGLQSTGRGLCVVTTREAIQDLVPTERTTTPCWPLDHLTKEAGAAVLGALGVVGPTSELEAASIEVKGHALTLSLMGRYLRLAFDPPDIAKRDCFHFAEADAETQNGHAFRVIAEYESWFVREGRHVEVAILRIVGLFDRPATPDCIAALCVPPAIAGLTEPLTGLPLQRWNVAVRNLRELDLVEMGEWSPPRARGYGEKEARAEMAAGARGGATKLGSPKNFYATRLPQPLNVSLDAHPLLREYFGSTIARDGLAIAAHARLFEHLVACVPFWPEGREGLLPLYQAIAHGCRAGRAEEACDVYHDRILRGTVGLRANYSVFQLGLVGLQLGALACFFVEPWRQLTPGVPPAAQGWLLGGAGFSLGALNRLPEAREATEAALERVVGQSNWGNAAVAASNLSEVELSLGDVSGAQLRAKDAMAFADRDGSRAKRLNTRTTLADAMHQAGELDEGIALCEQAAALHAADQRTYPVLYSVPGFRQCELQLSPLERAAWERCSTVWHEGPEPGRAKDSHATVLAAVEARAQRTLGWTTDMRLGPFACGLDSLTLGRVGLLGAALDPQPDRVARAAMRLDASLSFLRASHSSAHLPRALLPRAWLHALQGEWVLARQRLDESFAIATRGGVAANGWIGAMRLHLVDTLLHRARLFGRRSDGSALIDAPTPPPAEYPWPGRTPAIDLDEAAALIDACGYHRRDDELADARAALNA